VQAHVPDDEGDEGGGAVIEGLPELSERENVRCGRATMELRQLAVALGRSQALFDYAEWIEHLLEINAHLRNALRAIVLPLPSAIDLAALVLAKKVLAEADREWGD
jgi:hypothetical protein